MKESLLLLHTCNAALWPLIGKNLREFFIQRGNPLSWMRTHLTGDSKELFDSLRQLPRDLGANSAVLYGMCAHEPVVFLTNSPSTDWPGEVAESLVWGANIGLREHPNRFVPIPQP